MMTDSLILSSEEAKFLDEFLQECRDGYNTAIDIGATDGAGDYLRYQVGMIDEIIERINDWKKLQQKK